MKTSLTISQGANGDRNISLHQYLANSAPLWRRDLNSPDSCKIKQHITALQNTCSSLREGQRLLADSGLPEAAGPWKPTAPQPGKNASHPSSSPSGAPSPRGRCGQHGQGGADRHPGHAPGRTAASGRAIAPAEVSGAWGRWEKKQIYKPGSPRSFAAAGGSSSPSCSGRVAGGGCQRPRPPPERSGGPGPSGGRTDCLP